MKLSIGMIGETLQDLEPVCSYRDFDRCLNLEYCVFYDGDLKLHADTVYLFTEEIIKGYSPLSLTAEAGAAVIYLGNPDDFTLLPNISFICISPRKLSAANLSNRINRCFARYQKIDLSLHDVLRTTNNIGQLVKLATPLFQNEITVRDRMFHDVAHSYKRVRFMDIPEGENGETGVVMTADEMNILKKNPLYHEQISTPKPWFYQHTEYQMWCYDIFLNHNFIYRIKLIDTNHRFRPWDPELFDYFCRLVKKNLVDVPLHEQDYGLIQMFQSLLETQTVHFSQEMTAMLKKIGWDIQDRYLLLCLHTGKNNGKLNAVSYYCNYLQKEYHDTLTLQKSQDIILIVNLSRGYQNSEYEFLHQLTAFLRDENYRAGISFPYTPLNNTASAFRQASAALQKGLTYDPELWSYHFRKYRYHYLLGLVYEIFPDYSCILPELQLLEDYDTKNNTDFVETLKCYLKNDRNMLQTAKELNMHRSTLAYQLKKMEKIMDCDLEDSYMGALLRFVLQGLDL